MAAAAVYRWRHSGHLIREVDLAHLGTMARHARDEVAADVDPQTRL